MKVGIIAASGKSGSIITDKCLQAGMDVTAFVRHPKKLVKNVPYQKRDIFDISKKDVSDLDILINAIGFPIGDEKKHIDVAQHLVSILNGSQTRLLVVGSAGHLYTDDSRTGKIYDNLGFMRTPSINFEKAYRYLKENAQFPWTFFAPAVNFEYSRPETDDYSLGTDVVLTNQNSESIIGYQDYTTALVNEIKSPKFINSMMTISEN
ncbi:NAD(P)-dependent oxidoreductase [Oenococcus sp.]|uniref:NAD(P)-dependent oxidoreductase n=1 Tax=Oenococcus sp. TaxID=1979414 RepID=UPI0039EB45B8